MGSANPKKVEKTAVNYNLKKLLTVSAA